MKKIIVAVFLFVGLAQAQVQPTVVFEPQQVYGVYGDLIINTMLEKQDNELLVSNVVDNWLWVQVRQVGGYVWMNANAFNLVRPLPWRKAEECLWMYSTAQEAHYIDYSSVYAQELEDLTTAGYLKTQLQIDMCAGVEVEILEPLEEGKYRMRAMYQGFTYEVKPGGRPYEVKE